MEGTILVLKADGGAEMRSLTCKLTLEELQLAVGGNIEKVNMFDLYNERPAFVFVDEDGRGKRLPVNKRATEAWHSINEGGWPMGYQLLRGNCVIVQGDEAFMQSMRDA